MKNNTFRITLNSDTTYKYLSEVEGMPATVRQIEYALIEANVGFDLYKKSSSSAGIEIIHTSQAAVIQDTIGNGLSNIDTNSIGLKASDDSAAVICGSYLL